MDTMQLYVKSTSNCAGLPLQTFELLGPTWTGASIPLPFGDPDAGPVVIYEVIGWTDLFTGRPASVHAAHVRWLPSGSPAVEGPREPQEGYLVWGGNSGVRILDPDAEAEPGAEHLPPGFGRPLVWIEDPTDLSGEVLQEIDEVAWALLSM